MTEVLNEIDEPKKTDEIDVADEPDNNNYEGTDEPE